METRSTHAHNGNKMATLRQQERKCLRPHNRSWTTEGNTVLWEMRSIDEVKQRVVLARAVATLVVHTACTVTNFGRQADIDHRGPHGPSRTWADDDIYVSRPRRNGKHELGFNLWFNIKTMYPFILCHTNLSSITHLRFSVFIFVTKNIRCTLP